MASPPGNIWDGVTVPAAATAVIKKIEGFKANPYDDNGGAPGGTWTIGYGTIVDANGHPVTANTPPITEAQAVTLLTRDMGSATAAVHRRVKVALKTFQAAALISWTYNLGEGSLAGSTMLKLINANTMAGVPDQMRQWIHQAGVALLGLLRRRWAEAAIFTGMDPTTACTRAWAEIKALGDWPAF